MDTDTTVVEATVETPSFVRRLPVKNIVVVTLVVAGAVVVAKLAKDNVKVDAETVAEAVSAS